ALLELLVTVNRLQQRRLDQRREIRIRVAGERLQLGQQLAVRRQHLVARDIAAVVARVSPTRTPERPLSEQIDQRRLEAVVIARRNALAREDVLAELPHRPEVGVERVARPRTGGEPRVQPMHARHERLDRRLAIEDVTLPRLSEVAPPRELPARLPQPLDRDRKSTRLNSSHLGISYAVFCLKKKNNPNAGAHTNASPTCAHTPRGTACESPSLRSLSCAQIEPPVASLHVHASSSLCRPRKRF